MTLEYKTADGYTVTLSQIAQVFGVRETQSGKVADVLLTGAVLPVSLILEKHPADVAYDLEAIPEAEQVAAEVRRDTQWLDSDTVRNWQVETNTNGNLQWQGVEFDMPAIVERTQARSAELKAQIDARTAAVKSLNAQAVKNVRLGGTR